MIYSSKKNFIFVHIPKTGGMSVRRLLDCYNEVRLLNNIAYSKQVNTVAFSKHATAQSIKQLLPLDSYVSCFKFAFVRNPWDWLVSSYFYIRKDKRDPRHKVALNLDFKKFTLWLFNNTAYRHWHNGQLYYIAKGTDLLIDYPARFENFNKELSYIANKISVPITTIPYVNRTNHKEYKDYYDNDLKNYVAKVLEKDIDMFHYTF